MTKVTNAADILKIVETDISSLTDLQKTEYRKNVAIATKVLQSKLAEAAVHEFDAHEMQQYCKDLLKFYFEYNKEPVIPESVQNKKTSRKAKPIILKVLLESEYLTSSRKSKALEMAYSQLLKSSTITELRQNLKLYKVTRQLEEENEDLKEPIS